VALNCVKNISSKVTIILNMESVQTSDVIFGTFNAIISRYP
jgi:hypothetical protein